MVSTDRLSLALESLTIRIARRRDVAIVRATRRAVLAVFTVTRKVVLATIGFTGGGVDSSVRRRLFALSSSWRRLKAGKGRVVSAFHSAHGFSR